MSTTHEAWAVMRQVDGETDRRLKGRDDLPCPRGQQKAEWLDRLYTITDLRQVATAVKVRVTVEASDA